MKTNKFQFYLILPLILFFSFSSHAQDEDLEYSDQTYLENIRTVLVYPIDAPLNEPLINLRDQDGGLFISFDDLEGDVKSYTYTVVHCNADWTPSELSEIDYLEGFNEEDIENYDFSFNTLVSYTNYSFRLPNENIRFRISGNFLLKIYDTEDDRKLAITRRFMVVDPILRITSKMSSPANVGQFKTHQEIDFEIDHQDVRIKNPRNEIKVVVRQNGRWDNAITGLEPLFIKNNLLQYNYQGKIVFPAGKEFRFLDIRTFRYKREKIADITQNEDNYEVTVFKESSRAYSVYNNRIDLNGRFVIEDLENQNSDPNLRGDYADVFLSIGQNLDFENSDVYILGNFCNWQLRDEYKLIYSQEARAYVAQLFLKQGYYDYMYAVVPHDSQKIDLEALEGNWHETENEYSILVYFRPFGQRYDRLVGYYTQGSLR